MTIASVRRIKTFLPGLALVLTAAAVSPRVSWAEPEISVVELSAVLTSPDPERRYRAVRQLGERGGEAAVEALARTLRSDPSVEVRGWALRSLAQIGTQQARAAAIEASAGDCDERIGLLLAALFPGAEPPTTTGGPDCFEPVLTPTVAQRRDPERVAPPPSPEEPAPERFRPVYQGGWVAFGASYGVSAVLGVVTVFIDAGLGASQFIPLVGSIVGVSTASNENDYSLVHVVGALANLGQAIGLIVAVIGHSRARRGRRSYWEQRTISIVPTGPGLAMTARF